MNVLKEISRFLVSGLFIFSGLIKVNDPIGTQIKLEEYFEVFAYDFAPFFAWFIPAALFLSVFLSVLEVVLGIALLLGYRTKETSWALLILILFFTFLTFYSAYFNKVTDCGCFGDAIKLTPWQSFVKDIILLIFILIVFVKRNEFKPVFSEKTGHIVIGLSTTLLVGLCVIAIQFLPFIDFRAYKIGNNIEAFMQPSGELIYEYVMEKDGKEYRFEAYPNEPGYNFISTRIKNPEVQPKISDFSIWNDDGEFTEDIFQGVKLLVVVQNTEKTNRKSDLKIKALISNSRPYDSWLLTSSGTENIENYKSTAGWQISHFFADDTVLKTMIRSSPGILLLRNGTVLGKWHYNSVPELDEIQKLLR